MRKVMNEIRDLAQKMGITDEGIINLLVKNGKICEFEKGKRIVNSAEKKHLCCILLEGICRIFFVDEQGNEYTENFFWKPGQIFSNFPIYSSKKDPKKEDALQFDCEALSFVRAILYPVDVIEEAVRTNHEFALFVLSYYSMLNIESCLYRRAEFMMKNAADSYEWFLKAYPGLSDKVPQQYIASLLRFSNEHISRTKKKRPE